MTPLGFVSAILPDQPLEAVLDIAARTGFDCVELMCWPVGKAERRYAGVTHVEVDSFDADGAARLNDQLAQAGVSLSALGYYPNPLTPNADDAGRYIEHLKAVIRAAALLGVNQVNTFAGRDPMKSVDDNWPRFLEVWRPLVAFAEERGVRIGIENCPMLFSYDEWPGGQNLAFCPAIWRRMFEDIPSDSFGLNYDPSHMVWQQMDCIAPLSEFADKLFHVHAKDARVDRERLDDVGVLATPLEYHSPVLPGRGAVDWQRFFAALNDAGYRGPVCVEVEDRDFEDTLESRKDALRQSLDHLRPFCS
jgi:sugar phosphate isomerase/epimerase